MQKLVSLKLYLHRVPDCEMSCAFKERAFYFFCVLLSTFEDPVTSFFYFFSFPSFLYFL